MSRQLLPRILRSLLPTTEMTDPEPIPMIAIIVTDLETGNAGVAIIAGGNAMLMEMKK